MCRMLNYLCGMLNDKLTLGGNDIEKWNHLLTLPMNFMQMWKVTQEGWCHGTWCVPFNVCQTKAKQNKLNLSRNCQWHHVPFGHTKDCNQIRLKKISHFRIINVLWKLSKMGGSPVVKSNAILMWCIVSLKRDHCQKYLDAVQQYAWLQVSLQKSFESPRTNWYDTSEAAKLNDDMVSKQHD